MNKSAILITFFLLIGISINAQDLTCEDFKNGEFSIYTESPDELEGTILRNGNEQTEIYHKMPDEMADSGILDDSLYVRLEWVNDCNFRMFPHEEKGTKTAADERISENGGVLTEMIKIEGQCFYYKSTITVDDHDYVFKGRICKK